MAIKITNKYQISKIVITPGTNNKIFEGSIKVDMKAVNDGEFVSGGEMSINIGIEDIVDIEVEKLKKKGSKDKRIESTYGSIEHMANANSEYIKMTRVFLDEIEKVIRKKLEKNLQKKQ